MGFEDVHRLDRVFCLVPIVGGLDGLHRIDNHIGKEVGVGADDLARHGGFGDVNERLAAEMLYFDADVLVHIFHSFAEGQSVAGNDCGGVYAVFDEFVRAP